MHTLLAVDDGLVHGNLNWADAFFLAAAILAVLAALFHHPKAGTATILAGVVLSLAVGCVAFGLFLL